METPKEIPKKEPSENVATKYPLDILSLLNSVSIMQAELGGIAEKLAQARGASEGADRIRKVSDTFNRLEMKLENEIAQHAVALKAERPTSDKEKVFYRICLTGGPCAGKTTAIAHLTERLKERGFQVFTVPEAATLIFSAGGKITLSVYTDAMKVKFQYYLLLLQMMLEDIFCGIASTTQSDKIVVICDRGLMDGSAYLSPDLWRTLLNEYDLNERRIRDLRYDLVIHLTTAADGASEFYNIVGNSARWESVEEAIAIDRRLMEAWIGHPCFVNIKNKPYKSFQEKLDAVLTVVSKNLGIGLTIEFSKKYIVANPQGSMTDFLEELPNVKVTRCKIEDYLFYAEDNKEVTYYRQRVDLLEASGLSDLHQMHQENAWRRTQRDKALDHPPRV